MTVSYSSVFIDASIMDADGKPIFELKGVEAPEKWSPLAVNIVASKYFAKGETSVFQMIDRVIDALIARAPHLTKLIPDFRDRLYTILVEQRASFNSPVWFNLGVDDDPMCSACFIVGLDDTMESLLEFNTISGTIFKNGGGIGTNYSRVRAENEPLSCGGKASGVLSFLKMHDAVASAIKSGGKTRRAARMVVLDDDHPDIMDFIEFKSREEEKGRVLLADGRWGKLGGNNLDTEAFATVAGQNSNFSVRLSDDFMRAVKDDREWELHGRFDGKVTRRMRAREIFDAICHRAWESGDPGLQFANTINREFPLSPIEEIRASNPCSEFLFFDNSACNLASLNLEKYYNSKGDVFNYELMDADVEIMVAAMDAIAGFSRYPTPAIREHSVVYRPLGLGYCGLGAILMRRALAYGSDHAVKWTEKITKRMTSRAWTTSGFLATMLGSNIPVEQQKLIIDHVTDRYGVTLPGVRNAQISLLAPTGTIGFAMDASTTGIEPLISLRSYKTLVGGGFLTLASDAALDALTRLGYDVTAGAAFIEKHGTVRGFVKDSDLPVFATAIGDNQIPPTDHLRIMAAAQKYISGAISKTVNLPTTTTVDDIHRLYFDAWQMGLKAVAIYRDGSKAFQPVSDKKGKVTEAAVRSPVPTAPAAPVRRRLPATRKSVTHKVELLEGVEMYVTVGQYEDGTPGEIFLNISEGGQMLSGLADMYATIASMGLQYGIPLDRIVSKLAGKSFSPSGMTTNPAIPTCRSIADYLAQWLRQEFLSPAAPPEQKIIFAPTVCPNCKSDKMVSTGKCHTCMVCGTTTSCG